MAEFGYAGEILKVDLSSGSMMRLPTADYADRFLGGRGIAAKLYWDMVPPGADAFAPENCLICVTGPLAGFARVAGCRWQVCAKSPATEPQHFSYANLGGAWGTRLKYAGYDAAVVKGKSDRPVYLYIHDGKVEVKDASSLWGKSAFEASSTLKSELGKEAAVLTIGPAAENMVSFATLLADEGASGSGGMGGVMGSKNLKAIVVAGDKRPPAADPEQLRRTADYIAGLSEGPIPDFWWIVPGRTRTQSCHGCGMSCTRQSYITENGKRYKSFCQAIDVYRRQAMKYYDGWNETIFQAIRLCDGYGLDTCVMQAMIEWLIGCYKEGILDDESTGIPLSQAGSSEFIEVLTRKIAFREGFGDILAHGIIRAAESVGESSRKLLNYSIMTRGGESRDYDPRLILTNTLLLATEPRRSVNQLHDTTTIILRWLVAYRANQDLRVITQAIKDMAERFQGGVLAADFTTYEGKALAAKVIQDRTYAKESLILCDLKWPHLSIADTDRSKNTLESRIFSAITGRDMDGEELNRTGERVFNLQRAILAREGWGGRAGDRLLDYFHDEPLQFVRFDRDCMVPGKNGAPTSRKGAVVDRAEFEKMKSEYYKLRGWDAASGFQNRECLHNLQLDDIVAELEKSGLLR
jgi:aldehyde:ferredoxin oxidoreductase